MFTNFLVASSAGCYDWPVIKQIVMVLGYVVRYIYEFLEIIGIPNLGLCIIALTLIVKFALLPLTIKQQKFSKMQSMLQPEMKAIQAKYAGRRDTFSMQAMQQEQKELYAKYGISQTGGCLQTGIQMPIIIALYGVIRFLPNHIPKFAQYFENIVNTITQSGIDVTTISTDEKYAAALSTFAADSTSTLADKINTLSILPTKYWDTLMSAFNGTDLSVMQENYNTIRHLNAFCGIDLSQTPWTQVTGGGIGIIAILIPIIAGLGQWLSFQLTQNKVSQAQNAQANRSSDPMDAMNNSMKTMGFMMPAISVFFCFTIQAGVGLYWAMASLFQVVLQILINKHYRKVDMEEMKKQNMEKAAEKAKKRQEKGGEKGSTIAAAARINTKNIDNPANRPAPNSIAARANMDVSDVGAKPKNVDPNSLAAKAGMVQTYEQETGDTAASSKKKYKK